MNDSRRRFVRLTVTFLGAGALGGCGRPDTSSPLPSGSGGGTPSGGNGLPNNNTGCSTNGARATAISFNHGHTLLVPVADFSAEGQKSYEIRGTATHSHSIILTQAQRNTILQGTPVTVPSTSELAHSHEVTVACSPRG